MKLIAIITAILLAATMTLSSALKPATVEVDPPVAAATVMPQQESEKPIAQEEVDEEETVTEVAPEEPAPTNEKESVQSATTTVEIVEEHAKTSPEPVTEIIVDHAKTSPEPAPEIVIDHAKTTEPEIIIDSAKTGSDVVEESPVIVEEPSHETADLQTAMNAANTYAQTTYGVILDTSLGFDNSGYRFPANAPVGCTQEFLNDKACGIVDYTFQQLMAVNRKTIDDVRSAEFLCNVYVYAEGDNIYAYCFYA